MLKIDVGAGKNKQDGWVSIDLNPDNKPDKVAYAEALPYNDNEVDVIRAFSLLEHVKNPFLVIQEFWRVLKPDGVLYLQVPFIWVYHGNEYKDYWRFTDDGIRALLVDFDITRLSKVGGYFNALFMLLPHGKKWLWLARFLDKYAKKNRQASSFQVLAVKK